MIVNIRLSTLADVPATLEVDEDGLLTFALELQMLKLYEQGDISSTQAAETIQRVRSEIGKVLVPTNSGTDTQLHVG
jgi:hypothetical protein